MDVNDKVTLNRCVGMNQVKGENVKVHLSDHGKLCYDIKHDSRANYYKLSEFELVKSTICLGTQQKHDDEESLALLPTKKHFKKNIRLYFSSAMINFKRLQYEVNVTRASVYSMKEKKYSSGTRTQSDWL